MKFRHIFFFELAYQLRNALTWIFFVITLMVPVLLTSIVEHDQATVYLNKQCFVIITVSGSLVWLLVAGSIRADTARRDLQSGMQPLINAVPVRKAVYHSGRFLAGFVLNCLVHLAIPTGFVLALYAHGLRPVSMVPFGPAACLDGYLYISIPLSFLVTVWQFTVAAINSRKL